MLNEAFRAEGFKTITFGDPSEVDLNKQNIFPLMHITLEGIDFTSATQTVNIAFAWLDLIYEGKPLDQRSVPDEMSNVSNTEDIFHDLAYRVNRGWLRFVKMNNRAISVEPTLSIDAFYAKGQNKLAGYEASVGFMIEGGDIC
jgi:hypothetical protein